MMRYRFRLVYLLLICSVIVVGLLLVLNSCSHQTEHGVSCNCKKDATDYDNVISSSLQNPTRGTQENDSTQSMIAFDLFEDFTNMLHLTKSKTDSLLFTKDAKDKNGVALRLLDSLSEFATISEAKIQNFRSNFKTSAQFVLEDAFIMVRKKLKRLQRPKSCHDAPKLNCNIVKNCGLGCQIHHLIYCLAVSYALNRTLVYENNVSPQDAEFTIDWKEFFVPISSCTVKDYQANPVPWGAHSSNLSAVIDIPFIEVIDPRPNFLPVAMPKSLFEKIKCCHLKPNVWWIGQLAAYVMRPNSFMKASVAKAKKNLNLTQPYLGCHVRRTDKIGTEAEYHDVYQYYTSLIHAHQVLTNSHTTPRVSNKVFVATDDYRVFEEFRSDYNKLQMVGDVNTAKSASVMLRKNRNSVGRALTDIFLLSQSEYITCTLSSQFCRLGYELMQARSHVDRSWAVDSLDDLYYFGGQNSHLWEAVANHSSHGFNEISLVVGDAVKVSGNLRNGYMTGMNLRTKREGLFPAFKVKDVVSVYDD